jgi:hypothetical protein
MGNFAEDFFELCASGEKAPGNGRLGTTQDAGGLGVVEAFVNCENDGGPLFGI